jgi:hypothetical protein
MVFIYIKTGYMHHRPMDRRSLGPKMPWLRPFLSHSVSFKVNKNISIKSGHTFLFVGLQNFNCTNNTEGRGITGNENKNKINHDKHNNFHLFFICDDFDDDDDDDQLGAVGNK